MAIESGTFRRQVSGSSRRSDADLESLLYDPQTSGGLLVAASQAAADRVEAALRDRRRAGGPNRHG